MNYNAKLTDNDTVNVHSDYCSLGTAYYYLVVKVFIQEY